MLIFVAIPYSHMDKTIEVQRYNVMNLYLVKLFKDRKHAIAPVAVGHPIVRCDVPDDPDFWNSYSRAIMPSCDEVHVIMMDGWDTSGGVADEIKAAGELGIPVKYIKLVPGILSPEFEIY